MTVCIAARAGAMIVLASDRMVTQDNIQFEPSRLKITALTNSIFVMTSGDASLSTRLVGSLYQRVQQELADRPNVWLSVKTVTDWYVEEYNKVKMADAQASVLAPFGLTMEQFLSRQVSFDSRFVERLTDKLYGRRLPECEVIIAGLDPSGPHIYTACGSDTDVHDAIGFVAVGIGARHAMSHLMQVRHTWNADLTDTVVRTFVAKRRAEAAPGVGQATDLIIIGEGLGQNVEVRADAIERLDREYEQMVAAEAKAEEAARNAIREYINSVDTNKPDQQLPDQALDVSQLEEVKFSGVEPSGD